MEIVHVLCRLKNMSEMVHRFEDPKVEASTADTFEHDGLLPHLDILI